MLQASIQNISSVSDVCGKCFGFRVTFGVVASSDAKVFLKQIETEWAHYWLAVATIQLSTVFLPWIEHGVLSGGRVCIKHAGLLSSASTRLSIPIISLSFIHSCHTHHCCVQINPSALFSGRTSALIRGSCQRANSSIVLLCNCKHPTLIQHFSSICFFSFPCGE